MSTASVPVISSNQDVQSNEPGEALSATSTIVEVTFLGPRHLLNVKNGLREWVAQGPYTCSRTDGPCGNPDNPWLVLEHEGGELGLPEAYLRSFGHKDWGIRQITFGGEFDSELNPIAEGSLDRRWSEVCFDRRHDLSSITLLCERTLQVFDNGWNNPLLIRANTYPASRVAEGPDGLGDGSPWIVMPLGSLKVGHPERALAAFQHEAFGPYRIVVS